MVARRHDRLQLEVKIELQSPDSLAHQVHYDLDVWLLLPASLAVGPGHRDASDLYRDLRVFSRMRTPEVPLDHLVHPTGEGSPLASLAVLADTGPTSPSRSWQRDVRREARLVVRTLRSAGRRLVLASAGLGPEPAEHPLPPLQQLLTHGTTARDRFLLLRERLKQRRIAPETVRCLDACAEYLSLQLELLATRGVARLDELEGEEAAALRAELVALARTEAEHRVREGWRSQLPSSDKGTDAEAFLDQVGLLKRYVERVLHLHASESSTHRVARNIILGVAAALAMTWAVGVQIFGFYALGLDLSQGTGWGFLSTFAGLFVLAYILKDRIKAWSGEVLARQLPRFLDDQGFTLSWGVHDTPVGSIRERLSYLAPKELPPDVRARQVALCGSDLVGDTREEILHYRRRVTLQPRSAVTAFPRFAGVNEILRFNIARWVRTLASPRRSIVSLDDDDQVVVRRLPNRYMMPLILRLRRHGGGPNQEWWCGHRVFLSQRGVERVDEPEANLSEPGNY